MSRVNLILENLNSKNIVESVRISGNIKSILGNSYLKNEDKFIDWVEDYFTDGYDNRDVDSCELKSIKVVDIEPVIRKGYGVHDPKHPEYKELGGIPSYKLTLVVDGTIEYYNDSIKDTIKDTIDGRKITVYLTMNEWVGERTVKESFIMDRNQKEVDKITLKPREWCYFYSTNGIMYVVHNVKGKMRVYKNQTDEVKPTKEMKDKITLLNEGVEIYEGSKKIDVKKLEKELEQELILGMYRFGGFNNREAEEYSNIKIEKKSDGRLFIHVSAELDYDGCAELSELLDKVVSKYDRYAYFDMECPGRLVSVIEKSIKEGFDTSNMTKGKVTSKYYWGLSKGDVVYIRKTDKLKSGTFEVFDKNGKFLVNTLDVEGLEDNTTIKYKDIQEGFYKKGKRYKTEDNMHFVVKKVNPNGTLLIYDEDSGKEYKAEISDMELLNPVMVKESVDEGWNCKEVLQSAKEYPDSYRIICKGQVRKGKVSVSYVYYTNPNNVTSNTYLETDCNASSKIERETQRTFSDSKSQEEIKRFILSVIEDNML